MNTLWASANLYVASLHLDDFSAHTEPTEAFFAAAGVMLQTCAGWLAQLPTIQFNEWRERGFRAKFWIYAWIAQDLFELALPPELLTELGRLKLPLQIMTEGQ